MLFNIIILVVKKSLTESRLPVRHLPVETVLKLRQRSKGWSKRVVLLGFDTQLLFFFLLKERKRNNKKRVDKN